MTLQKAAAVTADGGLVERWQRPVLMALLLALLAWHAVGAGLDFWAAIHTPLELDYGEGIVWQQAALIPGPRMYGLSQDLPFIVFHYPPLYHLVMRALRPMGADLREVGRMVSVISTFASAATAFALVLMATGRRPGRTAVWCAAVAGLLLLCLHAFRSWGVLMRVDMLAVALGLAGVLAGARSCGRFWGTTVALLLCVAAAYTKQTQLSPGIAVFAVAVICRPRSAIAAAGVAGGVGLAVLAVLQWQTAGGFLQHIVGYNINRFSLEAGGKAVLPELGSLPFALLMVPAAVVAGRTMARGWLSGLRRGNPTAVARAMLLGQFAIANLMLVTVFKSGGSYNYLLDWLSIGTILLGVALSDLSDGARLEPRRFTMIIGVLVLDMLFMPARLLRDTPPADQVARQATLIRKIAEASKPVSSENMSVLMQAGKPVLYEPAIVTELALRGRWDERPLLEMIRRREFAFMVVDHEHEDSPERRSPAVDAAMREAYPIVERIGPELWLHLPD